MVAILPLKKSSPFSYPGTPAGVNFNHPASGKSPKTLRFSGVAMGKDFIRLNRALLKGTVNATISGGIDGVIGPYIRNANTTGSVTFSGNSTVAPTSICIACIFIIGNTANNGILVYTTGTSTTCPMLWVTGTKLELTTGTGSIHATSNIVLTSNVPYFAVASYPINSAGNINFAVTNLQTGQISTAAVANTFAATAPNGTIVINGDTLGDASDAYIAAAMVSLAGLNPSEVKAWAQDPWSFWYPPKTDLAGMLKASSNSAYTLTAAAGSYSVSGQAAGLNSTRTLTAAAGSYAVSGQNAGTIYGRTLTASAGSYSLSGQAAALRSARSLTATAGAYTVSGQAANLSKSNTSYTLTAAAGSYSVSGQNAGTIAARKLTATAGSYTVSGISANLNSARKLTAATGSYSVSGLPAALPVKLSLQAATGAYTLTGQSAVLSNSSAGVGSTNPHSQPFLATTGSLQSLP